MPAHAGIHIRRPEFMDTGVRRYDNQVAGMIQLVLMLP
jgi:hypothetical protein